MGANTTPIGWKILSFNLYIQVTKIMKNYYITFFIALISFKTSIAQKGETKNYTYAEFKKYSYLLVFETKPGAEKPKMHLGCGFFIRMYGKIFLITAYHVITGNDVYSKPPSKYPSFKDFYTFSVRFAANNKYYYFEGDLESIKKNSPLRSFIKEPDIYVIEIRPPGNNIQINSVEKFINKSPKEILSKEDTCFSFGYSHGEIPTDLNTPSDLTDTLSPMLYIGYSPPERRYNIVYNSLNIDSLNISVFPQALIGMSGSPVFIKNNNNSIELIGLQSGSNLDYNLSYIVKASEIIKEIKKKSKVTKNKK